MRELTFDALEDMGLVAKIADVERVIENDADKKQVVERGGFFGIGAEEIAIQMENVAVQGGKVRLRDMDMA